MAWLAVAFGGALGSVLRHAVNHMIAAHWIAARFPAGTTIVNLTGCLVIGLLAGLIAGDRLQLPLQSREFIFVGLLGGFTTFSSFGLEALTLARTGAVSMALLYVAIQVVGGLALVAAGYWLGLGR